MTVATEKAVPLYPAYLNLMGRTCLVVGGGSVGLRKATSLLDAGASVRLVCLETAPSELPPSLEWMSAPYSSSYLADVCLVFAAATPEVNRVIVADANKRGIWVNSASDPESGDFLVPASVRLGNIELAISTGGASPAVAAYIRDQLASQVDGAIIAWVQVLATLRKEIQFSLPATACASLLREFADPKWLDRIRLQGVDEVARAMRAVVNRKTNR